MYEDTGIIINAMKAIHDVEGDSPYYRRTRELLYAICFSRAIGYINVSFKFKEPI